VGFINFIVGILHRTKKHSGFPKIIIIKTKTLKLMPFLTTSQLPEFLLRHALRKSLQPSKHLGHILRVQHISLRLPNQRFNLDQAVHIEMIPKAIIHLPQHLGHEPPLLILTSIDDLVDESNLQHLLRRNPLAHDQRFVGLADPKPLDEATAGAAFGDEAEGCEGCEEEGVRGCVDEVAEGDEGGGETDGGTVEGGDEDFGVGVEGVCDVEVVRYEGLECFAADVGGGWEGFGDGDVGAAVDRIVSGSSERGHILVSLTQRSSGLCL
jgi:hypothetical protein